MEKEGRGKRMEDRKELRKEKGRTLSVKGNQGKSNKNGRMKMTQRKSTEIRREVKDITKDYI